jgi:hypothetical protein
MEEGVSTVPSAQIGRKLMSAGDDAGESREGLTALLVRFASGRVGSTLLMQLLATSADVVLDRVYPFENAYLAYFVHVAEQLGRTYDPARDHSIHTLVADLSSGATELGGPLPFQPSSVDRRVLKRLTLRRLWDAFSDAADLQAGHAMRFYAEKLLVGVDVHAVIESGVNVVLIDLVRDPRDVLASIRAFDAARGFPSFGRAPGQSDEEYLHLFIATAKPLMQAMLQPQRGVQSILVRYEDMIGDLGREASRLEAKLGLSLDHGDVEASRGDYRHHMTSDSGPASVGRWRADLRPGEIAVIEHELGAEMTGLGYAL